VILIAVTGRDGVPGAGFAHHFTKPVTVERLLEVLGKEQN